MLFVAVVPRRHLEIGIHHSCTAINKSKMLSPAKAQGLRAG